MTKLDAGLMTSLPASDPGSTAVWGSKRINPQPQSCLCLAWSGCPSNDDDDDDDLSGENAYILLQTYHRLSIVKPYFLATSKSIFPPLCFTLTHQSSISLSYFKCALRLPSFPLAFLAIITLVGYTS